MEGVNLKYNVTAEVLTPLSIGQGSEKDWVEGIDYVVKNGMMYHLDLSKMYAAGIDMERVANLFQKQDAKGVRLLIGEKLEQVSDFKMPMPCHSSNPIKTFFRNQLTNCPVLPGSSLKGAIRSVLFTYLRDNERDNASVFGSMKDGSDFMRFIRVGDFEFPAHSTELVNTKIYNLEQSQRAWRGAWKHGAHETTADFDERGFNTIYECLPVGVTTNGSIMLAKYLFELLLTKHITISHQDKKQQILNNSKEYLCRIINEHTKRYLEKELQFFKKYAEGKNSYYLTEEDEFLGSIPALLDTIENLQPNECVIKLSAGAGFHSITGDWQHNDYVSGVLDQKRNKDGAKPKSRKIAITQEGEDAFFDLMGFVKLTFED